ncbi:MAG: hypothetical protein AB1486_25305 [Planctomycetota bacterium]
MSNAGSLGIPPHVAAKIKKVLGLTPADLKDYDTVALIEELCDTALMFDEQTREAAALKSRRAVQQGPPAGGDSD